METQSDGSGDAAISTFKDKRIRLETRIERQHATHMDLLSSLQSVIPDLVPSLDLSLKLLSSFNHRPFTPTPALPKPTLKKPHPPAPEPDTRASHDSKAAPEVLGRHQGTDGEQGLRGASEKFALDECGSPLSVVRAMVAECLLHRVPFSPIDSSTVLRKLENDQNATLAEKAALRELGEESEAILAV